jgi:hypothetical protein
MRENMWVRVIRNIYRKGMERRRKEKRKIRPLSRKRKEEEKEEMKNQVRKEDYVNYKERNFWYSKKEEEVYLPTAGEACCAIHGTEM